MGILEIADNTVIGHHSI